MTKLTSRQRDVLVLVGFGLITHYVTRSAREDYFFQTKTCSGIPTIRGAITTSCRALMRQNLIVNPHENMASTERAKTFSRTALLTGHGLKLFETTITDEERIAFISEKNRQEGEKQDVIKHQTLSKWLDETQELRQSLREKMIDLQAEKHSATIQITEIAFKIGKGANNIDELLMELRSKTSEIVTMDDEIEKLKLMWPEEPT